MTPMKLPGSTLSLLLLFSPALPGAETPQPPQPAVPVTRPKHGDILRFITLPANLRANKQATLYSKVSGYIAKIPVDKGQRVEAGATLAEIEVPELAADLKRYQAEARVAESELQRLNEAAKKAPDLVLPQALDKMRGALDSAKASMERTETLLGFARITAPFPGIVTMRFMDPGAFAPAATTGSTPQSAALFTVMDFTTIRAATGVPELEAPLIKEGQPVKISLEQFPGRTFDCKISRMSYALEESTRTMLVEADIPNADLVLRPGMFATAKIGVEQHQNALLIPVDGVVMEKTAAFVFKWVDGKAKKTPVTLGFNDGTHAELLTGVGPDDPILLPGKRVLTDGQPVQTTP